MSVGSTSGTSASGGSNANAASAPSSAYDKIGVNDFMKMLIAELQNQDPMEPMDNAALINQVSQIRAIQSNTQLTTTLQSVMLGQNIATATSLINANVKALDTSGKDVAGRVASVTIENGEPLLHVGDQDVKLTDIREVTA